MIGCEAPECTATVADNRWSKIRAHRDGWFFTNAGAAWCPEHLPAWVPAWRERRRRAQAAEPPRE